MYKANKNGKRKLIVILSHFREFLNYIHFRFD